MSTYQTHKQPIKVRGAQVTARGLGWFSVALGAAQLIAPRAVSAACGLNINPDIVRAHGVREIIAGLGLLKSRNAAPWLWARVGGDVVDLATLAAGAQWTEPEELARTGAATATVTALLAVDVYVAQTYKQPRAQTNEMTERYATRSGFNASIERMRGAARSDFDTPRDMKGPPALRQYGVEGRSNGPAPTRPSTGEHTAV